MHTGSSLVIAGVQIPGPDPDRGGTPLPRSGATEDAGPTARCHGRRVRDLTYHIAVVPMRDGSSAHTENDPGYHAPLT